MHIFVSLISYGNKLLQNLLQFQFGKSNKTISNDGIDFCLYKYILISSLRKIILSWDVCLIHTELYTTKDNLSIAIRMLLQREYISMT